MAGHACDPAVLESKMSYAGEPDSDGGRDALAPSPGRYGSQRTQRATEQYGGRCRHSSNHITMSQCHVA
jgi:hypothetical protein